MLQEVFNFLDSKKIPENREYTAKINSLKAYFKDFFQKYPQKDINRISTMSDKEAMVTLIILSNPLHLQEILEALEKYPDIFKNGEYTELFAGLILYFEYEYIQDLVEACLSLNPFIYVPATIKLTQAIMEAGLPPQKCNVTEFIRKNPQAKKDLEVVFKNYSSELHNHSAYLIDAKRRYNISEAFDYEKAFLSTLTREEKRQYKKIVGIDQSEKILFLEMVQKYYNLLNVKLDEIVKGYEKREKERRSHNNTIEELKRLLDTPEEIKNIDAILRICPTDEIKEVVVDYIISHNKVIYLALISDYEKSRQNSDENLTLLFSKYGFDYSPLTEEDRISLKKTDYTAIEDLLKRLSDFGLNNINVALVSLTKLINIEELISKGVITKEWVQENNNLLYSDNNELNKVITNIDMLSKEGINMIQYSNSLGILKSSLLKHNLYLLRIYSLWATRTTSDINFLGANDLRERIEFIYSLGIVSELSDLNILNRTISDILKIKIANSLNIAIEDIPNDLSELYCDFSINLIPDAIKERLSQESEFISDIPAFLNAYRSDNTTLKINGVFVSIEKVKRNLAKIGDSSTMSCFYAIIYNGYYSYEEIEALSMVLIPEKSAFDNVVRS